MDEIYTYFVRFPSPSIREAVMPCLDGGYTVYIDDRLSPEGKRRAFRHAVRHIKNKDFDKYDVGTIETQAHKQVETQ